MRVLGHGDDKYPTGRLLESSAERSWAGLLAERRSHPAGELPTFTPPYTEVAVLICGPSIVTRQAEGIYQRTTATRGTIWLCPAGLQEDFIHISRGIAEVLHLYLPTNPFSVLATAGESSAVAGAQLRYFGGFRDPLIEQIAHTVLMEMHSETSSGKMLVESLAISLSAALFHGYSNATLRSSAFAASRKGLDRRRLQRVLDFVEAHIEDDFSVARLAATAHLSQFHFSRAFKVATGKSPHQYVTERRLGYAKALVAQTDRALADIALACRFSSQGDFSRAFRRATGLTPSQYRANPGSVGSQRQAFSGARTTYFLQQQVARHT